MKNNLKLLSSFIILSTLVVLFVFSASAWGCVGCNPPCGPCKTCQGGVCVNTCLSSLCQTCVNGHCEVCGGDPSKHCVNGQCVPFSYISYTYDEVGNRISMTDPTGTTSYTYDYLNRLISVTNPDLKTINYQYDLNGNRIQLTDPAGNITTYTYDDDNRLIEVNASTGSTTYQYDSLGNLTLVDYPNGTYAEYTYNSQRNWLTSLVNKDSTGTALSSYSYTYDNVGNRLSVTEHDGSAVTYAYDNIYQLTSEARTGTNPYTITYQYDNAGNRTQMIKNGITTNYTCNNNNQLKTETTGGTTVTYAYDGNGNLLSKTAGANATLYTWDWNNHLLSVSGPGGNTLYKYDGDGTRINKTQNAVITKYINDVALPLVQVLMETNNTGTVQAAYTYGNDLISMNRAGTVSYYHYDGLGSVKQMTDSSGAAVASYTYDSFGNVIAQTAGGGMASNPAGENEPINEAEATLLASLGLGLGVVTIRNRKHGLIAFFSILLITGQIPISSAVEVDATGNPYGFTGQQQFGEADDLVFLRARCYDPSIGRFISRDPILSPVQVGDNFSWPLPYLTGSPQKIHSYVYCSNNPINHIDPEGTTGLPGIIVISGITIIITIVTINCILKIAKFLSKLNELNKNKDADACDTQSAWNKATKTKEWGDMIRACGVPSYVG